MNHLNFVHRFIAVSLLFLILLSLPARVMADDSPEAAIALVPEDVTTSILPVVETENEAESLDSDVNVPEDVISSLLPVDDIDTENNNAQGMDESSIPEDVSIYLLPVDAMDAENEGMQNAGTEHVPEDVFSALLPVDSALEENNQVGDITADEGARPTVDNTISEHENSPIPNDDSVDDPEASEEVISIELPCFTVNESPFDFILDPQLLITDTNAARYGGCPFEAGATLFFENKEETYGLSSKSDRLTVTNRSTVPVAVTVSARVENLGAIHLCNDPSFDGRKDDCVYIALVDDEGDIIPVREQRKVSLVVELDTGEDSFSFGLTGACNPAGEWLDMSTQPTVIVTWSIQPLISQDDEADDESQLLDSREDEIALMEDISPAVPDQAEETGVPEPDELLAIDGSTASQADNANQETQQGDSEEIADLTEDEADGSDATESTLSGLSSDEYGSNISDEDIDTEPEIITVGQPEPEEGLGDLNNEPYDDNSSDQNVS